MSCGTCRIRRSEVNILKGDLAAYCKHLSGQRYPVTPEQLTEIDRCKTEIAVAKQNLADHEAECHV